MTEFLIFPRTQVLAFLANCLQFLIFPQKTAFDISCKLSPLETVYMKCQTCFRCLLKFLPKVFSINQASILLDMNICDHPSTSSPFLNKYYIYSHLIWHFLPNKDTFCLTRTQIVQHHFLSMTYTSWSNDFLIKIKKIISKCCLLTLASWGTDLLLTKGYHTCKLWHIVCMGNVQDKLYTTTAL